MFLKRKRLFVLLSVILAAFFVLIVLISKDSTDYKNDLITSLGKNSKPAPTKTPLTAPPANKTLANTYHIFQRFNNCGPASLSMALSYYGLNATQEEIGDALRPYQVASGDNDDKSVTLEELAKKSKEYGLIPYHRPMGNIEMIKYFVTYNMPIIARTWTKPNEDIGHYRIIKGYDDTQKILIQDDSLQGKNLEYSYEDFNILWKKFNYEFLVLVPKDRIEIAEKILGENADEMTAWKNAVKFSQDKLAQNPNDIYTRFNLSVALKNIGQYKKSVEEFEKIESFLPFRTLWYQIDPIEAYFELGNYGRVFAITDKILNNQNRAFSELYILRGKSFQKLGSLDAARIEFEKAVLYNQNLKEARELLSSVPS